MQRYNVKLEYPVELNAYIYVYVHRHAQTHKHTDRQTDIQTQTDDSLRLILRDHITWHSSGASRAALDIRRTAYSGPVCGQVRFASSDNEPIERARHYLAGILHLASLLELDSSISFHL